MAETPGPARRARQAVTTMATETDRVCGMQVEVEGAQYTSEHEGTMYYFCSKGCKLDFEESPERYLDPEYVPSM